MDKSIEVFRDFNLRGALARRSDVRKALITAAEDPWFFDLDRSVGFGRTVLPADILAFGRKAADGLPAAGLTLWGQEDGYHVPNIVPTEFSKLSIAQYNAILEDFIEHIVRDVAAPFDYRIDITDARQKLEDWTSEQAAHNLRLFSAAANKSSRASHPMDQRRWFDFIIAVHESRRTIGTDRLLRWLNELEGWDEESARDLAGEYETALSLLQRYDER